MARPDILPATFEGSVSSQLGLAHEFKVVAIPAAGKLRARVDASPPGAISAGVRRIVVNEVVSVTFIPDDPFPGGRPLPPQTEQTLVKVAEGDGSTPLEVEPGHVVMIEVFVSEMKPELPQADALLVVSADTWEDAFARLTYTTGSDVLTTFANGELTARQGELATTGITAVLTAGPAVTVEYELIGSAEADRISLDPLTLSLVPGVPQRGNLALRVRPDCPAGRKFLRIVRNGGSLFDFDHSINLEVKPAPIVAPGPGLGQAREAMERAWTRLGGPRSYLGLPVQREIEVVRAASGFEARFRSGVLGLSPSLALLEPLTKDVVTFDLVAMECQMRQESLDEIYGVVTVIGAGKKVITSNRIPITELGPSGQRISLIGMTILEDEVIQNYKINVALIEHDSGDVDAIAAKVAEKISQAAGAALGALTGVPAEAVADNEGFDDGIEEGVILVLDGVFGIGDDPFNSQTLSLPWESLRTSNPPAIQPPVRRPDDPHVIEDWTHKLIVSGTDDAGDRGQYALYFKVKPETIRRES